MGGGQLRLAAAVFHFRLDSHMPSGTIPGMAHSDYITVAEAAQLLNRSRWAVCDLIRRGRLPARLTPGEPGAPTYYLILRRDVLDFQPLKRGPKPKAIAG